MKKGLCTILLFVAFLAPVLAAEEPTVVYWNSDEGEVLRTRISPDADYWDLSPVFTVQKTQAFCGVASAITILNAMTVKKPVDPMYYPYPYFTQMNYFTPQVQKVIKMQTVMSMGLTRDQLTETLSKHGVTVKSVAGDTLSEEGLRTLLKKSLRDDGTFVLVNYLRTTLHQEGGGHWSVLAAYDAETDSALILDVAKFKYAPAWVGIGTLRTAIDTIDTTSNKPRGLIMVSNASP